MNISDNGLHLIEDFEGFRPTPYQDSVGVWTIGYGTTSADVAPLPKFLTRSEAVELLRVKLNNKYAPAVNALGIPLNQNQFDALCSFCYNLGPNIFSGTSIGNFLRTKNYVAAANDILNYDHAGGTVLPGLQRRREAERGLFLKFVTPPDPHHYRWFDTGLFRVNSGKLLSERLNVMEYDLLRRHPFIHRPRLHVLRQNLLELANRLVNMNEEAKSNGEKDFYDKFHRGWRQGQLRDRSEGKRLA